MKDEKKRLEKDQKEREKKEQDAKKRFKVSGIRLFSLRVLADY